MRSPAGKRLFDVVVASALTCASSPIWLLIAAAVKRSSPGPVFHRARRCGLRGEPFTLYKFRTMRVVSGGPAAAITAGDDPRVTPVGRFIRKWKLDELPQLLNVVKGDMSLVGPRPEDPLYVQGYREEERRVLDVRPGITSPASILFRHEQEVLGRAADPEMEYREVVLPKKLAIDIAYFSSNTLRSDVGLLVGTVRQVFTRSKDPTS